MADTATTSGTIGGQPVTLGIPGLPGTGEALMDASTGGAFSGISDALSNVDLSSIGGVAAKSLLNSATSGLSGAASAVGAATGVNFADLFFRSVIIILGFIFMAIGLAMFKAPIIVTQTTTATKKVAKLTKVIS